jgi:hypothetical protein
VNPKRNPVSANRARTIATFFILRTSCPFILKTVFEMQSKLITIPDRSRRTEKGNRRISFENST